MRPRLVWTRLARADLIDIYIALGTHDPAAAERFYDRIEQRAEQLVRQPRMGPRRPNLRPSARVLIETPYLILYETVPDTDDGPILDIEVVRILDGRRDLAALFPG